MVKKNVLLCFVEIAYFSCVYLTLSVSRQTPGIKFCVKYLLNNYITLNENKKMYYKISNKYTTVNYL